MLSRYFPLSLTLPPLSHSICLTFSYGFWEFVYNICGKGRFVYLLVVTHRTLYLCVLDISSLFSITYGSNDNGCQRPCRRRHR